MNETDPQKLNEHSARPVSMADAIRELVFGVEDGLVSILGLVTGVAAGTSNERMVLLSGVAGAVSGAISMAAGNYLGVKSQIEVLQRRIREEKRSIDENPEHEHAELETYYTERGLTPEEVETVVPAVERNKEFVLEEMTAHELGISPLELSHPAWRGFWIFIAYIIAATIPVLPYALFSHDTAMIVSIAATIVALFAAGAAKTIYTRRKVLQSGLEMLGIALAAGVAGYFVGHLVPV